MSDTGSHEDKASLKHLDNTRYTAVGRCIYCGTVDNLTDEHIMPLALNGTAILPHSSCRGCAKITGRFEQIVLRGPFWPVRVFRDLKSRTKHKDAPSALSLRAVRNGRDDTIELPIGEYPFLLHFPLFPPPAYLGNSNYSNGILMSGLASVLFGPRPDDVAAQLGATEIKLPSTYQPVAFAQMLAKIAYAMAVAERETDQLDGECFVLSSILGTTDEIGRFVGTLTKPFEKHADQLHRVSLHRDTEKGLLVGEVQLFADSETPSYGIILGKLRPPKNAK